MKVRRILIGYIVSFSQSEVVLLSNASEFRKKMFLGWLVNTDTDGSLTLSKRQILDSSKPEKFADDISKSEENDRKLSKRVENTEGHGEITRSKDLHCTHV